DRPPNPCAPMPSALTASKSSMRNSSIAFCGPRFFSSCMSIGAISDSFAIRIAFSAVPPMPRPSIPGGHHPAPIVGTVATTQSTIESDGFSITNFDLFSEPPPFAAIFTSTVLPGTTSKWTTAGVVSFVFLAVVIGVRVGSAHAFVDHVGDAHRRALPAHVHSHFHECDDDAGILADGPLAFRAHPRIGQNLCDGVLSRRRLLGRVGFAQRLDIVLRVVIRDVLQGVGDAVDEIAL